MPILSGKLLVPVDVIVDSREASKNQDIVEGLRSRGLRVAVQELEAGDYYLLATDPSKALLVERKTVIDFANSIRDNRVWDQAKRLREAAAREGIKPVIVLEGWLGLVEKRTRWNIAAVLRVIDELVLDWGIPVIPTHNKQATIAWLAAKARSLGRTEEKRVVRLRVEKKPMSLAERILYVAEGLVGPTLARRLLERFGTLRRIANASVQELMSVRGIGEKRAREIYLIFNTEWNSVSGEVDKN
ncbi:ERCC4 domain-containing protein [Hyperthermus butylicus]|uniref:ERCC4-type nuclease n=1 Tax=Hyperthermus butylicus (strain DSM 5456 / JCM 9403 / PLM1-5) TaxID=415426 RepID=A2BK04_HYPBU|nr:ERCC4 domain-containing protein [Hyperthermus butylicus]ABM80315.1 ERCC4-type nuclease [Hyperthermus butylicus DSM 5456]